MTVRRRTCRGFSLVEVLIAAMYYLRPWSAVTASKSNPAGHAIPTSTWPKDIVTCGSPAQWPCATTSTTDRLINIRTQFPTQHGAVLTLALIFLILLTLLGISVMNVSQQELQMAGQFMTQTQAQEQAEDCLHAAQAEAATLVDTALNVRSGAFISSPGHINVADGDVEANINDPNWWTDPANTLPCGEDGRYVIEYLGVQHLVLPEDRYTGLTHALHTLRLSSHGVGGRGARVVLQAIFLRNSL